MTPVIEVKNLKKYFSVPNGELHAVDDVSFKIERGTTMGIVGESGCGKSTLGRTIIHLLESTSGQIFLNGEDVTNVSQKQMKDLREKMQIIFQDPYSSLNPRMTIEETIREPLKLSGRFSKKKLDDEVDRLMNLCGIEERLATAYPHELDGGRRQRVGIARALALHPDFIVCDEPVSALDVSIQAQIINMLMDLQQQLGMAYLFIAHDLAVVRHISQHVVVMYLGHVMEINESEDLYKHPLHPYTRALLSAIPVPDPKTSRTRHREILQGDVPSPINPPKGCVFCTRCRYATEECKNVAPVMEEVSPGHMVACHHFREID